MNGLVPQPPAAAPLLGQRALRLAARPQAAGVTHRLTDAGAVDLAVPRDRNRTFEPQIVRKGQTRLEGSTSGSSLYTRGMTTAALHQLKPDARHRASSSYGRGTQQTTAAISLYAEAAG